MARKPGKIIDTWTMKDGDNNPVKVNIRMVARGTGTTPGSSASRPRRCTRASTRPS